MAVARPTLCLIRIVIGHFFVNQYDGMSCDWLFVGGHNDVDVVEAQHGNVSDTGHVEHD